MVASSRLLVALIFSICFKFTGGLNLLVANDILRLCPHVHPAVYSPACPEGPKVTGCSKQEIEIGLKPQNFMGIDDPTETMSLSGIFVIIWRVRCQEIFSWNDKIFTAFERDAIWHPTLFHHNAVSDYGMDYSFALRRLIFVEGNSTLRFVNQHLGVFASTCAHLTYKYFPFDSQSCAVKIFVPYFPAAVNLTLFNQQAHMFKDIRDMFVPAGMEWSFLKGEAIMYKDHGYFYMDFKFYFRRKPTYYIFSSLGPVLLLSMLQVAAFFISPDSSDRAMFSVTLLLALIFLNSQILAMVPVKPDRSFTMVYMDLSLLFSWGCTLYAIFVSWLTQRCKKCQKQITFCGRWKRSVIELVDLAACCLAIALFLGLTSFNLVSFV